MRGGVRLCARRGRGARARLRVRAMRADRMPLYVLPTFCRHLLLPFATLLGLAAAAVPSASELQARMDAAIRSHAATFTVPAGAYNFSMDNFNISGASGLRVQGAGATLWFGQTAGVNISNSESLHISGLSINYSNLPRTRSGIPAVTYNLLNCSDVISEDITIYKAPFFSVTAFNGGGGHVFRRFSLPNDTTSDPESGRPIDPWPHERDAFHFTDLRRGVVVEDSHASGFGDDFFVGILSSAVNIPVS